MGVDLRRRGLVDAADHAAPDALREDEGGLLSASPILAFRTDAFLLALGRVHAAQPCPRSMNVDCVAIDDAGHASDWRLG